VTFPAPDPVPLKIPQPRSAFYEKVKSVPDLDLVPIKDRAEAAVAGPWDVSPDVGAVVFGIYAPGYRLADVGDLRSAEFITHARADIPALIAEVERLRVANELLLQGRIVAEEKLRRAKLLNAQESVK
jgi:hypothetical protein